MYFITNLSLLHPFIDGNGRMGRLWQTLILIQQYPVFEFLPVESLIKEHQEEYYNVLSQSDKKGASTPFIEFMLGLIFRSLESLLKSQNRTLSVADRIDLFRGQIGKNQFARKDYLLAHKDISEPTASRDLKWAVDNGVLEKIGVHRLTKYKFAVT